MENDCVVVWTTISRMADGHKLASMLVSERLAACVNVLALMESVYRWKGDVESEQERQLIMKTTIQRVPALKARLFELHDYEVPEFIVMPVVDGSERVLELGSRVHSRVISFALFLPSGSRRLPSRYWFGWSRPGRSHSTARSISR